MVVVIIVMVIVAIMIPIAVAMVIMVIVMTVVVILKVPVVIAIIVLMDDHRAIADMVVALLATGERPRRDQPIRHRAANRKSPSHVMPLEKSVRPVLFQGDRATGAGMPGRRLDDSAAAAALLCD